MTGAEIAHALHGKQDGPSSWMCLCVAHEDKGPSLHITVKNGKVLFHCFAGCNYQAIQGALRSRGLLPEKADFRRKVIDYKPKPKYSPLPPIIATYYYHDESGAIVARVTRHAPTPREPKPFRPWYLDERGEWIMRKHPRQVLYHLDEVLKSPTVFLVEGEKDADRLRSHGFVATTTAGGGKVKWLPEFTETLRGREVILIPDNDKTGRECVIGRARALMGAAVRLTLLELEGDGVKDVSDWFDAGHGETELAALIERAQVIQ